MTRDLVYASIAPAISASIILILLLAMVPSTDVHGAPAILSHFSSGHTSVDIEFTEVLGEDYTGLSIDLPKRSNVLGINVDLSGGLTEDIPLDQTLSTAEDWDQGTQSPADQFIHDAGGFHLDSVNISVFRAEQEISVRSNAQGVATGDFNDDGRDDVVVTNYDSDTVTVITQDNQGKLSTKAHLNTADQPMCVATGDFNDDGRDDFAVGSYGGMELEFFLQKAAGGFSTVQHAISYRVLSIATGDFNGDDMDDVVMATYGKRGITMLQNATGFTTGQTITVGESGSYYYYNHDVRDVAVADFNRDGRDDVVFATCGAYTFNYDGYRYGKIKFYYQSTSGSLNYQTYVHGWTGCWNIDAGDVSGDGRPDIVTSQAYVNKVKVWYQTGSGGWSGPTNLEASVGRPTKPLVVDIDGDGRNDTLVGGLGESLAVMLQRGGRIGSNIRHTDSKHPIQQVSPGDLNDDGHLDVVTSNTDGDSVSVWLSRPEFTATWTSHALVQPVRMEDITFTYLLVDGGAESRLLFSLDKANWTEIVHGTNYDVSGRPDTLFLRFVTTSPNLARFDRLRWLRMDMNCSSYPSDIQIDVGADGRVDWEMTGELNTTDVADGFEDAITAYVQRPNSLPGPGGWVNVPLTIHSDTPGHLDVLGLHVTYNNASARPWLLSPANDTYANSTPTFRFQAVDSNDDRLRYVVQITRTDFDNMFDTISFDGRSSQYNDVPGEGFSRDSFPSGTAAGFTLPWIYALEVNQTFKWRVLAYDGQLMSEASETFEFRVDARPPMGQAKSPRYSRSGEFTVEWSAVDPFPGSGLATGGPYDVQYRLSSDASWTDWFTGTTMTSATFSGEEGATYLFRMRARDAVMNTGQYATDGDTMTTVDTLPPAVTALNPRDGQSITGGQVQLRVDASDGGEPLPPGSVEYSVDSMGWSVMPLYDAGSTVCRCVLDTSSMEDGQHTVRYRATDAAGHVTEVSVRFLVDNHDPTCRILSPEPDEVVMGRYIVRIEAEDSLGISRVDLTFDGLPGLKVGIATYNAASGKWEMVMDTTNVGEANVALWAVALDKGSRTSAVAGPVGFSIDNKGPDILFLAPGDGYLSGRSATVRVVVNDMHFDPASDEVLVRVGEGEWAAMSLTGGEFTYPWRIDNVEDGEHEIWVRATDGLGHESRAFTIARVDHNAPVIDVDSPQAGDVVSGTVTVNVTVEEPFLKTLEFSVGGAAWQPMTDGQATFDSNAYPDGAIILMVRATDGRDQESEIPFQITVDNSPPVLTVVNPPRDGMHLTGEIALVLMVEDRSELARVQITRDGRGTPMLLNEATGYYEAIFDASDREDGEHLLQFTAWDVGNNRGVVDWTINVDNSPPVILILSPDAIDIGVVRFEALVTDAAGLSEVQLKIGDGNWIAMVHAGSGLYYHEWETGEFDNADNLKYIVRATDTLENSGEELGYVTVDNTRYTLIGIAIVVVLVVLIVLFFYMRHRAFRREAAEEVDDEEGDVMAPSEEKEEVPPTEPEEGSPDVPEAAPGEAPEGTEPETDPPEKGTDPGEWVESQ